MVDLVEKYHKNISLNKIWNSQMKLILDMFNDLLIKRLLLSLFSPCKSLNGSVKYSELPSPF
jgi:hypothetical protein